MKKKMSILVFIISAVVLSIGAYAASNAAAQYIGEEKAKTIALEHAGVTAQQATFFKTNFDYDDGFVVYDVEFYTEKTSYDYEIGAVSGEIYEYSGNIRLKNEADAVNRNTSTPNNSRPVINTPVQPLPQTNNAADTYIGGEKAKSIALASAGLAETQTRRLRVELDREHGTMVYEVDFKSGQLEYEYDIDAVSGAILKSDIEYDD